MLSQHVLVAISYDLDGDKRKEIRLSAVMLRSKLSGIGASGVKLCSWSVEHRINAAPVRSLVA